jgi:hypothetical protein
MLKPGPANLFDSRAKFGQKKTLQEIKTKKQRF